MIRANVKPADMEAIGLGNVQNALYLSIGHKAAAGHSPSS
jgi:hypothetical protein